MKLQTLWDSLKERLTINPAPAPTTKPRRPRQPKTTTQTEPLDNKKSIIDRFKDIELTITNHHGRIHELEQIEHRRVERAKEMKTNG